MVYDKIAAIRRDWRVSEQTLLILAVIGGVFGIWIGMTWPMYHKASKQKFRLGIPCIALVWILLLIK